MSNMTTMEKVLNINVTTPDLFSETITVPSNVRVVEYNISPTGANVATDDLRMRFNSDTGYNYDTFSRQWSPSGGYAYTADTLNDFINIADSFSSRADQSCSLGFFYPRSDSEYNYGMQELMSGVRGASGETIWTMNYSWRNTTNPITSMTILTYGGSWNVEIKFIR